MAGNRRKQGGRRTRSLGERLLLRLIVIRRIRSIILQNRDFAVGAPAALRLRAWRHGFSRRDWLLYELDRNDPGEYLPHHASLDFGFHFPHSRSLNDKLLLARALDAIGIDHPTPLAFVLQGRILPCSGGRCGQPAGEWITEQAARYDGVVLKPVIGLAGSGLLFIRATSAGLTANGAAVTRAGMQTLRSVVHRGQRAAQHPYMAGPRRPAARSQGVAFLQGARHGSMALPLRVPGRENRHRR